MFNCRLYKNSGFNAVNIPDSPALLEELNYVDVQPLDILTMLKSVIGIT